MNFIRFMFRLIMWVLTIGLIISGFLFDNLNMFASASVLVLIQLYYELVEIKEKI